MEGYGGAIAVDQGSVTLSDGTFLTGNTATATSGGTTTYITDASLGLIRYLVPAPAGRCLIRKVPS